jgi:hypothetical protein
VNDEKIDFEDVTAALERAQAEEAAKEAARLQQHAYTFISEGSYAYPTPYVESKLTIELRRLKGIGTKVLNFWRDGHGNWVIKSMAVPA